MNYFEWSQEYLETAKKIEDIISMLKAKKINAEISEKKELDLKITKYREVLYECMQTANLLFERYKGVA